MYVLLATSGLGLLFGASGCATVHNQDRLGAATRQQLNSGLSVASASADAGQYAAAERLYTQLSRHFPDAAEPRIGLGYLALRAGDFVRAGELFAEAEARAKTPAARAESLLGAGRAGLGRDDVAGAKANLLAASGPAKGTPIEAWVTNGLGVLATIEGDHARARQHFDDAVKLSSSHPMITANLVRALAQSGQRAEARRLYARYSASHWLESDAADLSRLLREKQETEEKATATAQAPQVPRTASGAQVQLYAARSEARALVAWKRLLTAEAELLGSLTHRVVKAAIKGRGTFYRLRAGPLKDKRAAKRLCIRLKRRGHGCFVPAAKWPGGGVAVARVGAAKTDPAAAATAAQAAASKADEAVVAKTDEAAPAKADQAIASTADPAVASTADEAATSTAATPADDTAGSRSDAATAAAPSGYEVQLYAARSEAAARAAWDRLLAAETEALGNSTHRVFKADIPGKGVFYRLRVGSLENKAAAKRLCARLKARGRDCFVPARVPANVPADVPATPTAEKKAAGKDAPDEGTAAGGTAAAGPAAAEPVAEGSAREESRSSPAPGSGTSPE